MSTMSCGCTTSVPDGSKENPLILRPGKNFSVSARLKNLEGRSVDLTNYVGGGRSQIRPNPYGTPSESPVASITVTVTAATTGRYTLSMDALETDGISPGMYQFDVEFVRQVPSEDTSDVIFGGQGWLYVTGAVTL